MSIIALDNEENQMKDYLNSLVSQNENKILTEKEIYPIKFPFMIFKCKAGNFCEYFY